MEPTGKPAKPASDGAGFEPVKDQPAFLVTKRTGYDQNEVDNDPQPETSECHQHQDACAYLSHIKSVDSKGAEKKTE